MRAGGQNRGVHQRERSIVSGFAPVLKFPPSAATVIRQPKRTKETTRMEQKEHDDQIVEVLYE